MHAPTLRFRTMFAAVVFSLMAFSMMAVGALSLYFGWVSINEVSGRFVRQTLGRVEDRLRRYPLAALEQNAEAAQLVGTNRVTAADFRSLVTALRASFTVRQEVRRLYLALEQTGELGMLEQDDQGEVTFREVVQDGARRVTRIHRWSGREWRLVETQPWDGYDPRQRPFYRLAVAKQTNAWTPTYTFWPRPGVLPRSGVTFAAPVRDAAGQLIGVWGDDFETTALCDFLKSLRGELPGYAFVFEDPPGGPRRVVAHPEADVLHDPRSGALYEDAAEVRDDTVRAFLARLGPAGDVASPTGVREFLFRAGDRRFFGAVHATGSPNHTAVAMILPARQVIGDVIDNAAWYLLTIGCVGSVAGGAILWLSHRTAAPLHGLQREAEAIGRLELQASRPGETRILEIHRLSSAMGNMKTNLRSFQKYLPPDVVGDLVRSGCEATLGGEKITATIYFSDIAGFTGTAELLAPEKLVEHLGAYLGAMSEGVNRHGGTVDKYIGDAVMAFWNAPRRSVTHALDACRAAWANQEALAVLQKAWAQAGQPLFPTRIGIHTGAVIVGNIGSEHRMNYTLIGDSVNLASRLQGLNRVYGTGIIISEATFTAAGDEVVARPLDCVGVKGRTEGVFIHELLGMRATAPADVYELRRRSLEAFAAYRERRFADAAQQWRGVLARFPADGPAAVLLARCEAAARQAPPPEWDGIWRLSERTGSWTHTGG